MFLTDEPRQGLLEAVASLICAGLVGCTSADQRCHVVAAAVPLINGISRATYLKLEPREEAAVVQVRTGFVGVSETEACSGVLVSERIVLTARHCLHDLEPVGLRVFFSIPENESTVGVEASVIAVHPDRDVVALALDERPDDVTYVTPLPPAEVLPHGWGVGSLVQTAGFGRDLDGNIGVRAFGVEEVIDMDSKEVSVSAHGLGGACLGDSGGPLLVRADSGQVKTLALLSRGSGSCVGTDEYTRLDAIGVWLAEAGLNLAMPTVISDATHDTLGHAGRCFQGTAVWFSGGHLRASVCSRDRACGWDRQARGYRCLATHDDPCHGISDVGTCEDGVATRCFLGHLERNPCAACGLSCARSPETGEPVCLVQPGGTA